MKFQAIAAIMAATSAQTATSQSYMPNQPNTLRLLEEAGDASTLRCFYECLKKAMTAEQCEAYIRSELGPDLSGSIIPDLMIEINRPRPVSKPEHPYWRFGIPTNIQGDVMCNLNGSTIQYRFDWVTESGTHQLPPVDCYGLGANDCCEKFKKTVAGENIPLVDVNGNCLSCWVHQEYLEPVISRSSGELAYINHEIKAGGECQPVELSQGAVQKYDAGMQQHFKRLINDIDEVRNGGVSCADLDALQKELQFHTRGLTQVMSRVSDLLCGYCVNENGYKVLPEGLDKDLADIRKLLLEAEVKSDVNKLVIYTDHQGFVLEPPKIGGSREELDGDRDDPDCNEANGLPPREPIPEEADEYYPPQTPEDDPEEEDYYMNKPPPGPNDPPQACEAGDIMTHSEESESKCYECRRCLIKECDWDEGAWCRKLFRGKVTGSINEWKACLFTNGGETYMDPSMSKTGSQKDWCDCAVKCEDRCVQNTTIKYEPRPQDLQCNTQNLATQSDKGEFCHDCRLCLQETSADWRRSLFCRKLILGERQGSSATWQACLESNGESRVLSPDSAGDGFRDSWAPFARKCDESCYKDMDDVAVPGTPICTAADVAERAGEGEVCENCKTCIQKRCTYWRNRCEEILMGGNGFATPKEWQYCFENCGAGQAVGASKGRELTTDDGSGTERALWCGCARECDNQCHHAE